MYICHCIKNINVAQERKGITIVKVVSCFLQTLLKVGQIPSIGVVGLLLQGFRTVNGGTSISIG